MVFVIAVLSIRLHKCILMRLCRLCSWLGGRGIGVLVLAVGFLQDLKTVLHSGVHLNSTSFFG